LPPPPAISERYVNELLYEAGASFTLRAPELRLRKAADLLAHAGDRRISDICLRMRFTTCPISTACFRRRFGLTRTAGAGR